MEPVTDEEIEQAILEILDAMDAMKDRGVRLRFVEDGIVQITRFPREETEVSP